MKEIEPQPHSDALPQVYLLPYKKRLAWPVVISLGLLALSAAALMWLLMPKWTTAYQVSLGARDLGVVKDKDAFLRGVEEIRQLQCEQYAVDVEFAQKPELANVRVPARHVAELSYVLSAFQAIAERQAEAAAIYVDGQLVGATEKMEDAQWVIEEIRRPFLKYLERGYISDLRFVEDVEVRMGRVPASAVKNRERVYRDMLIGDAVEETYTVQQDDTLRSIAVVHNMTVGALKKANVDLMFDEAVRPGMQLNMTVSGSVVNYMFVRQMTEVVDIPFKTEVVRDPKKYVTVSEIKDGNYGEKGQKRVQVKSVYVNGVRISEEEIGAAQILKQPKNQVVTHGTKPIAATAGTSMKSSLANKNVKRVGATSAQGFSWPAEGRFTSPYGQRGGRMHKGIDIANAVGTPVYAAKAGRVTVAAYSPSYGKVVYIDSGEGQETRYAHNSKLIVEVGDRVEKGSLIALMGNTGQSRGSHCHFEIILGGEHVDPLRYLPNQE